MKATFKMNWSLRRATTEDLIRPHNFAFERVGFIFCKAAATATGLLVLAESYESVADENYVEDRSVGARINGAAIRAALQISLTRDVGIFHVHLHEHKGRPGPSETDVVEFHKLIPDFFNVNPSKPHGAIILSEDSAFGLCWVGKSQKARVFDRIEFVGSPLQMIDISA